MLFKYLFLLILFIFVPKTNSKKEIFTLAANEVLTFVLPVFSTNSTLETFNDTLNFFFNLPNLPKTFYIYAFGDIHQCLSNIPYTCDITNTKEYSSLRDDNFLQKLYDNSIIENQHSCYVYLKLAYLLALKISPLCDNSTNCYIQRINFIALTDYDKIDSFYSISESPLEQSFYFAFTTSPKPYGNGTSITIGFYYVYDDDIPDSSVANDIFSDEIYYTFDPTKNFYNVFIVTNASSLHNMTSYAAYILEDAYSSISEFWGFLSPLFYVVAVKLENGSYYQTVNVFLNGMNSTKFVSSLQNKVYGTLTPTLDTSLAQSYFKKIYNKTNTLKHLKDQWNVLITDEFPHWLKNTSISFDSFSRHLDIYLMSFSNSVIANELENDLKTSMNEILINDKNASKRGNHIILLPFDGIDSIYESVKGMPTVKKYMGASIFSYQQKSQWWIWVIIGSILFLVVIAATLIILLWKYRKWKQIMQKYSWAVDSGISIKEANTFVEAGKELFIEGNFITVDFNIIIGKGSSAVVYEGLLSTESPVSIMYPRLETRNYSNCKTAIKIGNIFSKDEFEQIFREVEAAIKIGWHRHICCLLGWSVYQSMPILLFELIEGQDLLSWAQSFQGSSESSKESSEELMSEKSVTQILWQISDGMEYISSLGILHRDLAARNILLSQRLEAKITDFGLASSCHETSFTYEAPIQRKLPIRWMAPEALKNRTFSEFSDVWSFATLAWEVFSKGEIPYGTMDGNDILEYISAGNRLKLPEEISDEWKKLLNICWSEERDQRPSFKEIRCKIGAFLETQTLNYGYLMTFDGCNNKNL